MTEPTPLILTLQLDTQAFTFFNALRKKHFPPHLNYLDAHLTLFHHLPPDPAIGQLLETITTRKKPIVLDVVSIMKLGRGVAYKIKSPELSSLHADLQTKWQGWLTNQDRQKLNPHVTVKNKVDSEKALLLYQDLTSSFQPFTVTGIGLSLWEYQGGPWQKIKDYQFQNFPAE